MPAVTRKPSKQQNLIHKLVTVEFSADKCFWGRETKIANQLIKKYTYEFLEWLNPPHGYKVNSLVYFLGKAGQDYLSEQLFEYKKETSNLSPNLPIIYLEDNKIGEDAVTKPQTKTLKDFLNLFN